MHFLHSAPIYVQLWVVFSMCILLNYLTRKNIILKSNFCRTHIWYLRSFLLLIKHFTWNWLKHIIINTWTFFHFLAIYHRLLVCRCGYDGAYETRVEKHMLNVQFLCFDFVLKTLNYSSKLMAIILLLLFFFSLSVRHPSFVHKTVYSFNVIYRTNAMVRLQHIICNVRPFPRYRYVYKV